MHQLLAQFKGKGEGKGKSAEASPVIGKRALARLVSASFLRALNKTIPLRTRANPHHFDIMVVTWWQVHDCLVVKGSKGE